jgi:hypothetical protein
MDQDQLEQIKTRAAEPAKVLEWAGNPYADEYTSALEATANDVPALVAEVERLRLALAGHLFDGESITAREAVRAEMINIGIRAFQSLDGVKELLTELKEANRNPAFLNSKGAHVDVRKALQEALYAAGDETRPLDTPPASQ